MRGGCEGMIMPSQQMERSLPGYSFRRRNREAIGDLPCARELLEQLVAQGAAIFAFNPDARFHLNPAKAGVALRADGVGCLHTQSLPQALRQIQRSNLESG